jgi:hypothetical protein
VCHHEISRGRLGGRPRPAGHGNNAKTGHICPASKSLTCLFSV